MHNEVWGCAEIFPCVIPVVSLLFRVHVVYAATFCVPRTILRSALTALYVQVFDVYMARWAGNL